MAAPKCDPPRQTDEEDLVNLFGAIDTEKIEEARKPGIFGTIIRHPLIAIGCVVTGVYIGKGMKATSRGDSLNLSRALQGRVLSQFATISIVIASVAYVMVSNPTGHLKAIENGKQMTDRAYKNFTDAQARKAKE